MGVRKKVPYERISTRIETDVLVVPRRAAVDRVSDMEKTEGLTAEVKRAALQHLYLRYLLGIGDSGTHNVLVREARDGTGRLIAGIDLEETRARRGASEWRMDHLFKKGPSKRQVELYLPAVSGIKPLSPGQLDPPTREHLTAIGIDIDRLEEKIRLWHKLQ